MDSKRILRILHDAQNAYEGTIGNIEKKFKNKVDFDFSIDYQPSDGFVLLNYDTANLALLKSCIDVINRDKRLTVESHEKICI